MVSRVESKGDRPGHEHWHFATNVMPGKTIGINDQLEDGKVDLYRVVCLKDDSQTVVLRASVENIQELPQFSQFQPEAVLSLGDLPYETQIYSNELQARIAVRISHQEKF